MFIWKSRNAGISFEVEKRAVGEFKEMLMEVNNSVVNEM